MACDSNCYLTIEIHTTIYTTQDNSINTTVFKFAFFAKPIRDIITHAIRVPLYLTKDKFESI